MSQEFRFRNIEDARNYLIEEIMQNELMSKNHKKVCATLNYIDCVSILVYLLRGVFHFSFYFFAWYFYRSTSCVIGLKACAGMKRYKSIIKKKKSLIK